MAMTLSSPMLLEPLRATAAGTVTAQPASIPSGVPAGSPTESLRPRLRRTGEEITQPAQLARTATAGFRAPRALPGDAPQGAEPALWALLDPAELAFFGATPDASALTYARGSLTNVTVAPGRGRILDVRA